MHRRHGLILKIAARLGLPAQGERRWGLIWHEMKVAAQNVRIGIPLGEERKRA